MSKRLGVGFRYYNMHAFLDQTQMVDPSTNPTLPGRIGDNINEDDAKAIREIARDLVRGAEICDVDEEFVFNSVKANYLAKKLDAPSWTATLSRLRVPTCARRAVSNEEQFTLCLNHSLNNECGICSACEYDVSALVSMILLSSLSFSAPYMGNTSLGKMNAEDALTASPLLMKDKDGFAQTEGRLSATGGIGYTFHAVPDRKLKGYDKEQSAYSLRPFAMGGPLGSDHPLRLQPGHRPNRHHVPF